MERGTPRAIWLVLSVVAAVGFASGCDDGGDGDDAGVPDLAGEGGAAIEGLKSITVDPRHVRLEVTEPGAAQAAFRAIGRFDDGREEDLTGRVVFHVEDAGIGVFEGAVFRARDRGGISTVVASAGGVRGIASLEVLLRRSVNDPDSSMPADPAARFAGPRDAERAPRLVYPNDGALLPPNLGRLEFHFLPGAGNTLFALRFENPVTDLSVYLRCAKPLEEGCLYEPDTTVWRWLAESNRGTGDVTVRLLATDEARGSVGESAPIRISFSQDDVNGGLYYWTTSGQTAIVRYDFANPSSRSAETFISTELTGGTCVGCHALSRDGRRLVAEAGGQNSGRLLLMDVPTRTPLVPFGAPAKSIFESWSPDGSRYAGVYGDRGATDWNVLLFDGATGAARGHIPGTGTEEHPADHPDWSADGQRIAFVKVGIAGTNQRMYQGGIQVVDRRPGTLDGDPDEWGEPYPMVGDEPGKNRYYPAFSPDGGFLVYDESTCPDGYARHGNCNADTDPTATLWAIELRRGAAPVPLSRANAPGLADAGATQLSNSYPKWSPFVFHRTAEVGTRLQWITFSSTRRYGLRRPPPGGEENPTGTLLWMAAVDPDRVAQGEDPSFPAFCLPFQDLTTSNHIAQWVEQVVPVIQ